MAQDGVRDKDMHGMLKFNVILWWLVLGCFLAVSLTGMTLASRRTGYYEYEVSTWKVRVRPGSQLRLLTENAATEPLDEGGSQRTGFAVEEKLRSFYLVREPEEYSMKEFGTYLCGLPTASSDPCKVGQQIYLGAVLFTVFIGLGLKCLLSAVFLEYWRSRAGSPKKLSVGNRLLYVACPIFFAAGFLSFRFGVRSLDNLFPVGVTKSEKVSIEKDFISLAIVALCSVCSPLVQLLGDFGGSPDEVPLSPGDAVSYASVEQQVMQQSPGGKHQQQPQQAEGTNNDPLLDICIDAFCRCIC